VETIPQRTFLDLAKELGPPSSMMPWCCQTQKFAPFSKYLNENFPDGVLSIEGLRRFESGKRMGYQRISQNPAIPKKKTVCPILNWTALDVWLYILWKKLPYNPVYKYGYDRIGCWVCPHKGISSFSMMEKTHPKLLGEWNEFLFSYASCSGKDEQWVSEGKWRMRREPYEKNSLNAKKLCGQDNSLLYEMKDNSNLNKIKEFLKVFGKPRGNQNISVIQGMGIQISIIGHNLRVSCLNDSTVKLFEKQLMKGMNCVGCGACVGACKALKVENRQLTIDENECTHCLKCVSSKYLRMGCIALNYGKKRQVWKEQPN
jgi:phosphoadenosine phosphosulfate reductase